MANLKRGYYDFSSTDTLVTKTDQESSVAAANMAKSFANSETSINIKMTTSKTWYTWYMTSYIDKENYLDSAITSRTPNWPSFAPLMHKYEVCVFQKDTMANKHIRMACMFFDFKPTTHMADT